MSLPNGYKRLEYIQSSGTQYVNSGFVPNQDTRVVMVADWKPSGSVSTKYLFGAEADSKVTSFSFCGTLGRYQFAYNGTLKNLESSYSQPMTIDFDKNVVSINGLGSATITYATFSAGYPMFIFAGNRAGSAYGKYAGTVYSCQIYDNGTMVRDFIPCKTDGGEIGLWDDVNSVLYGNAGKDTFTAGPVALPPTTPTGFVASLLTETTVQLSWSASEKATGYKLYKNGVLLATLIDTSYTDTIQPSTSYIYTLTAYNDNGESDPATISVQTSIPPEAPTNFRASSVSIAEISLAWDAVTGADGYQLKRNGIVIYSGDGTSYTDSGLTAETAYTYTLFAVNTAGSSAETTLEATTTKFVLVTDRTASDVAAQNAKGTYNAADMNRVGTAMNYVADRLRAAGYDPHISPKTDWMDGELVTPADEAAYLGDLADLRKQFTLYETTHEVPPDIEKLNYIEANSIEQILVDIDALLTNIAAGWLYSGEIYSGEV